MKKKKIGIIGAGASGMMAAISAAKAGATVLLFEKNERIGQKILATGNGKCNFTHEGITKEAYHTDDFDRLETILHQFSDKDCISFFQSIGMLAKAKNGYYYPATEQASTVLDVLRYTIEELDIEIITDAYIKQVQKNKDESFSIQTKSQEYRIDSLVLACGSRAGVKNESNLAGYDIAKQFGLELVPVVPALVQLACEGDFWKSIAGIRTDANIKLIQRKNVLAYEFGELQITEYGLSGIPIFQLSRLASYAFLRKEKIKIEIDLLPAWEKETLCDFIKQRISTTSKKITIEQFFTGLLNKKILLHIIKKSGMHASDKRENYTEDEILYIINEIKHFEVVPFATKTFSQAQVCAGGVMLHEMKETMETKKIKGLYITGELLNVDGRCGGYNLQWAWASGYVAGSDAGRR